MSTVTVTGTAGPAITVSALTITDVSSFSIDCASEMLTVVANSVTKQISIAACTTLTLTVSAPNTYSLTIT